MVPDGVVRPRGSIGALALLAVVVEGGSTWLSAVCPAEARQAPRHRTKTNIFLGKEDTIFSRPALYGRTHVVRTNRSMGALIVSKRHGDSENGGCGAASATIPASGGRCACWCRRRLRRTPSPFPRASDGGEWSELRRWRAPPFRWRARLPRSSRPRL